jgi:hypothetical protein
MSLIWVSLEIFSAITAEKSSLRRRQLYVYSLSGPALSFPALQSAEKVPTLPAKQGQSHLG